MALITFVLVVVFGGLTLFFHNDEFIKMEGYSHLCSICGSPVSQPMGDEKAANSADAG
ncbi:putative intracellular septation protein [Escherichia coli]|uniref:Putative intracellular septation protein n=1 Tax=Escherichia coli TaxID=562 RepID=A0A2X1IYY3_ECOLX|nr:putative intracellular septation protein [Escherichia coli]